MTESPPDRAVPAGWSEVTSPDYIIEKYDPRLPTLFEADDRDIGVHILPDEPNTPHADQDAWRVGFVRGHRDNLEAAEPIARCAGRDTAFHLAHEFMAAHEADDAAADTRVENAKAAVRTEAAAVADAEPVTDA
jgi:hypothetical protein